MIISEQEMEGRQRVAKAKMALWDALMPICEGLGGLTETEIEWVLFDMVQGFMACRLKREWRRHKAKRAKESEA